MQINEKGMRRYFSYPLDVLYAQLNIDKEKVKAYEIANEKLKQEHQRPLVFDGLKEDIKRTKEAIKLLEDR
jgi:hypothetical protein